MKWFMFKMLFCKAGFGKTMRNLTKEQLIEYKDRALEEENYELASVISHYIDFKKYKQEQILNTEIKKL